ncbi:hypothetical protein D3C71_2140710 [compost metagenome]
MGPLADEQPAHDRQQLAANQFGVLLAAVGFGHGKTNHLDGMFSIAHSPALQACRPDRRAGTPSGFSY